MTPAVTSAVALPSVGQGPVTPTTANRLANALAGTGVRITPDQLNAVIQRMPKLATNASVTPEEANQFIILLREQGVEVNRSQGNVFWATVSEPPFDEFRGTQLRALTSWINEPRSNPAMSFDPNLAGVDITMRQSGSEVKWHLSDEEFRTVVAGLTPTARQYVIDHTPPQMMQQTGLLDMLRQGHAAPAILAGTPAAPLPNPLPGATPGSWQAAANSAIRFASAVRAGTGQAAAATEFGTALQAINGNTAATDALTSWLNAGGSNVRDTLQGAGTALPENIRRALPPATTQAGQRISPQGMMGFLNALIQHLTGQPITMPTPTLTQTQPPVTVAPSGSVQIGANALIGMHGTDNDGINIIIQKDPGGIVRAMRHQGNNNPNSPRVNYTPPSGALQPGAVGGQLVGLSQTPGGPTTRTVLIAADGTIPSDHLTAQATPAGPVGGRTGYNV